MTARCGSNDQSHRSKTCRACDAFYKRRYNEGAPRLAFRVRADAATCAMCGLVAGNSRGVPVYRYPLRRHVLGRKNQAWIGSIGLCDLCVAESAELKPQFRRAA